MSSMSPVPVPATRPGASKLAAYLEETLRAGPAHAMIGAGLTGAVCNQRAAAATAGTGGASEAVPVHRDRCILDRVRIQFP